MSSILNIAAYKFVSLDQLPERRKELARRCCRLGLKGTILLSEEGINLFLAGPVDVVRGWVDELRTDPAFADLEVKESFSDSIPFNRMLVKIKREIIAFGVENIDPACQTSPKLPPEQLKQWLDEGREVVLLDVRNDFEVEVGTFEDAVPVGIDHFRQFDDAISRLPDQWREKPLVMFCTGGIRCEKAGPLMERKGFRNVYQLEGGILKYFELCGGEHWRGDCFVFDDRVALNPQLQETGLKLCYACQAVLTQEDQQSPHYVYGQSCPRCYQSTEVQMRRRIEQRHQQLQELASALPGCQPHQQRRPIRIPQSHEGLTLIDAICSIFPQTPRTEWEQTFAEQRIMLGNIPVRAARVVQAGEQFIHSVPEFIEPPVNGDIKILWEDESIIVVDKPAPLPVHASGRFNHNTLLGLLNRIYHPEVLKAAHRLDANTTGVLVLCRKRSVARELQQQFETHAVAKTYLAVCWGHPAEDQFTVDRPITIQPGEGRIRLASDEGMPSMTSFEVLERRPDGTSLLKAMPLSGRTNQIRVHLWDCGHPIVGDPLYLPEGKLGENRTLDLNEPLMLLHADRLEFKHPQTGLTVCFASQHRPLAFPPADGMPPDRVTA